MTKKEYDKLIKTPGKKFSPTPATPIPEKFNESLFYDLYWSKLSKSKQREIEKLAAIRDPANKRRIISYDIHKGIIKQALREGKPVPLEVLKDYPDLEGFKQNQER